MSTDILTIQQAADALAVSTKCIRRLIGSGDLAAIDVAPSGARRRTLRISRDSIESFLSRRKAVAMEAGTNGTGTGPPRRRSRIQERLEFLRKLNGRRG